MYTVTIYGTPMSFPFSFTYHTWVEISDSTTTDRYDFWGYPGLPATLEHAGYIYKNIFPNHLGTTRSPFAKATDITKRQFGRSIASISGDQDSIAAELYQAIYNQAFTCPFRDQYNMVLGPNCNSHTSWLISLVPNTPLSLPWHCWGKNFKY